MDTATKRRHRAAGICIECHDPVAPGKSRCSRHLLTHRERSRRHKDKRHMEGRCWNCGRPFTEMDGKAMRHSRRAAKTCACCTEKHSVLDNW